MIRSFSEAEVTKRDVRFAVEIDHAPTVRARAVKNGRHWQVSGLPGHVQLANLAAVRRAVIDYAQTVANSADGGSTVGPALVGVRGFTDSAGTSVRRDYGLARVSARRMEDGNGVVCLISPHERRQQEVSALTVEVLLWNGRFGSVSERDAYEALIDECGDEADRDELTYIRLIRAYLAL